MTRLLLPILLLLTLGATAPREVSLAYDYEPDDMAAFRLYGCRAAIGNCWRAMTAGLIAGSPCRFRMDLGCFAQRLLTRLAMSLGRAMNADGGSGQGLG